MRKQIPFMIVALVAPCLMALSAAAEDTTTSTEKEESVPVRGAIPDAQNASPQKTKPKSKSGWAMFPVKVLAAATGAVLGTPVNAVRKPLDEEKYGITQMAGEKPKPRLAIPCGVFWAPFSAVSGILEAPFYAVNNSIDHFDKPFSKGQFSLGKEEPISPNLRYGGETYK